MPLPVSATEILDRSFLDMRHRLIDLAASLDRIDGGGGAEAARSDGRLTQVREALIVLGDGQADRAARVQLVFSDAYDAQWRND